MPEQFSDIRTFAGYRINTDAAEELLAPNEIRGSMNMIEENASGKIVNMKGFDSIMAMNPGFVMPRGTFKCIGTTNDIENSRLIYFLCDTDGDNHSILMMDTGTKALQWIFNSEPLLNLQPGYRVRSNAIEGLLYWTDGYFGSFLNNDLNPPRKINISKAAKFTQKYPLRWNFATVTEAGAYTGNPAWHNMTAYIGPTNSGLSTKDKIVAWKLDGINRNEHQSGYSIVQDSYQVVGGNCVVITDRPWRDAAGSYWSAPGYILKYDIGMYFGVDWQVMDVLKYPPNNNPSASFDDDPSTKLNDLKSNMFQFKYRFIYDDNEPSTFSSISLIPLAKEGETVFGNFSNNYFHKDNVINVWMDSGPMEVVAVELVVRKGNIGSWKSIELKQKYDEWGNCLLTCDINFLYKFYDQEAGVGVDQGDAARPFDFVPITAYHQQIFEKNRLLFARYREGADNINIDVSLIPEYKEIFFDNPVSFYWACRMIRYHSFVWSGDSTNATVVIDLTTVLPTNYQPSDYQNKVWKLEYNLIEKPESGTFTMYGVGAYTSTGSDSLHDILNQLVKMLQLGSYPSGFTINDIWAFSNDKNINAYNTALTDPHCLQLNLLNDHELGIMPVLESAAMTCEYFNSKYTVSVSLSIVTNNPVQKHSSFKAGATHPFAIAYYDRGERVGSALTNSDMVAYVKFPTEYNNLLVATYNYIKWEIRHVPPIPATHYRLLYARNTTTFDFLQMLSVCYKHDKFIRVYVNYFVFNTKKYISTYNVAPIEVERGDVIRFLYGIPNSGNPTNLHYLSGGVYESNIVSSVFDTGDDSYLRDDSSAQTFMSDADGNKIKSPEWNWFEIERTDLLNTLNTGSYYWVVEIQKKKKDLPEDSIPFYEIGEEFEIGNPHTDQRYHKGADYPSPDDLKWQRDQDPINPSVLPARGIMWNGDVYVRSRIVALVKDILTGGANGIFDRFLSINIEDFSFSDYYDSANMNIGRINVENRNMKFMEYISFLRFGERRIENTRVNGLSSFRGDRYVELQAKFGPINNIEEVGDTLKVLQTTKQSSVYIGRAGVTMPGEEATQILSSTKDVLGTLIVHKTNYGTVHPESVVKYNDRYCFFDFDSNAICRDAGNGIENLCIVYNINSEMKKRCALFGSAANVDVVSGYDQEHSVVYFTFISGVNSFTLAFRDSDGAREDGFVGFFDFIPDAYGTAKQLVTSFKNNGLWLHNSETAPRANFYGVQYKYWFTHVFSKKGAILRFLQMLISSPFKLSAPNAGDIKISSSGNNPRGMVSLLKKGSLTTIQGQWCTDFGKNMITNQSTPQMHDLIDGQDLSGKALSVRLEGEETVKHEVLSVEVKGVTA